MEIFQNDILINTIQPYLVLKTDAFCQHLMSTYGISHFYGCRCSDNGAASFTFVPDGCSNILFAYGQSEMTAEVIGPTIAQKVFPLNRHTDYFGVRFLPGENPCFASLSVKELINNNAPLGNFIKMRQLNSRMNDERTFDGRMRAFLSEYQNVFESRKKNQHELFRQLCRVINDRKGMLTISELEKLSGYSARYINYVFESEAGMSAKQFCRILKLQSVISVINSGKVSSMSKIAADYHFYDQSHFIHDFVNFAGKTPKEYQDEVTQKEYRKCVTNV